MENKSGPEGTGKVPASGRSGSTQIFICDASAEGGRLLNALQVRGFAVVDVPFGLLPSRIHYEVPHVVICDADAREAPRLVAEAAEVAGNAVSFVLVGHKDGTLGRDRKLLEYAAETIHRPVDLDTAIETVSQLVGPPSRGSHRPRIGLSNRAPVLVASARKPYRSDGYPSDPPSSHPSAVGDDSLWPIDSPPGRGPAPVDSSRFAFEGAPSSRHSPSSNPPGSDRLSLSPETQAVLEEGRKRVRAYSAQSPRPIRLPALAHTGGDDIRTEFLQALAEPLDADLAALEVNDAWQKEQTSSGEDGVTTSSGKKAGSAAPQSASPQSSRTDGLGAPSSARPNTVPGGVEDEDFAEEEKTNPGGKPPTQPPGDSHEDLEVSPPTPSQLPLDDLSDLLGQPTADLTNPPLPRMPGETERPGRIDSRSPARLLATIPPPTRRPRIEGPFRSELPTNPAIAAPNAFSGPPIPRLTLPEEEANESMDVRKSQPQGTHGAMVRLARAVRDRQTGAVAQQEGIGLRRIVLTDGDISTVTSTLEGESLAHFLRARGDITEEVLQTLGTIPGFGRHAGAALIARGLLEQEDLWPVLRAHAEWLMVHALVSDAETLFEESVPARILEEPAVFGGAAGTEIYLETVRRIVSEQEAFALLGPPEQVLSMGKYESLLAESALSTAEQHDVFEAVGKPISVTMGVHPDLMPVLLGLTYLGILSTGGADAPAPPSRKETDLRSEEMDDEAFMARVRTRRALVEDGDYFNILGISRGATSFEVDRARDELLAEYSYARLTPRTAHLKDDLELLRATVEEAHLVLRDEVRRKRYRAALEAIPRAAR